MKRTLITCASSEIGRVLSETIDGHELLLTTRNKYNVDVEGKKFITLDFFDGASIDSAVDQISSSGGGIDNIVFIIPRIPNSSEFFPASEEWTQLFDKYFIKPLSFLKKIYENNLISENGGKIVFVSGLSSKAALSHYAFNNCIRNAWLGQAKTLALALGEKKISVNTLSLGGVLTSTYKGKLEVRAQANNCSFEEQHRRESENIPLGSYASVEDVASAIESLIGPLSNHMTGQNILLDGGFFRGY